MKIRNLAAMLLTFALFLGASQSVLAGKPECPPPGVVHNHACEVALAALSLQIDSSDFTKDRDKDGVGGKVTVADCKLHDSKPYDALDKLGNIRTKINGLLADRKTKIDPDDAAAILGEVEDAELCILTNIATF